MSDNFRVSLDRKTNYVGLGSTVHPGSVRHLPRPVSHSASECRQYCGIADSVTTAMGGAAGCVCTSHTAAVRTHPRPVLYNERKFCYVIFAYGRVYL